MRIPASVLVGFLGALLINAASHADPRQRIANPPAVPIEMAGAWTGDAEIFDDWTVQRSLPVTLTIAPNATVAGTIGDATLRNGHFESNRNAIERAIQLKTDWIVIGDLDGDVIRAEGIRRASVMVPLDWIDGHFEGGVNTSGSHVGGKKSMWLAAGRMRLERSRCP